MANFIPWTDHRDPNKYWPDGPHAPRRPPKSNAKCKRQVVWPRDKKQKGAHTWTRFKDVLSGKGPDMWAGKQGDDGPNRQAWSHWGYGPGSGWLFDNMGYHDRRDNWPGDPSHWLLGHRPTNQKYDFNTRKYKTPRWGDWSDVKWDRRGRHPLWIRTRWGHSIPWDKPFSYKPWTGNWDYHRDQLDPHWAPFIDELHDHHWPLGNAEFIVEHGL